MPATAKTYPEWVQAYRTRGMTVKKKGNSYYLYKRTSKRVPGKKYPQPVDTYVGLITPDGVVASDKKKVALSNIVVREYGFSKTVWDLCPEDWKKPLKDDWEDVLVIILRNISPETYLKEQYDLKTEEDFNYQFPSQTAALSRRLYRKYGVGLTDLEVLRTIYLVRMEKNSAISVINSEQKQLLDRLGISLEV